MLVPQEVEAESRKMYVFLFFTMLAIFFGFQAWQMIITNMAVENAHLTGFQMGVTQSVRELPGLLSFIAVAMLALISEHRLANIFVFILGVGVFFGGFIPTFYGILLMTFIMSTGFHYYDTLSNSIILQYFSKKSAPIVLGKLRGLAASSSIAAAVLILIMLKFTPDLMNYKEILMVIGGIVLIIAVACLFLNPMRLDLPVQKRKIKFKKNYWLFYMLTLLSGGRRQIFLTFAIYLLVEKFHFSAMQIVLLFLANNCINFFINPLIGRSIDKFGERKLMTIEYISVIFIFGVYAFSHNVVIIVAAYIYDQLCMNMVIVERTFFQKIAAPEDIASGMAMGFGLTHIAAVIIPAICGMLWIINYKIAFIAGIIIALVDLCFIQLIDKELIKANNRAIL